jgi:hypothetical protein
MEEQEADWCHAWRPDSRRSLEAFAWLVVSANHKRLWDLEDKPASAWALLKHADKRMEAN